MIDISDKKVIIFDFDGTIADTLPLCFESFRRTFYKFNNETLSDHQIEALFGSSEETIIRERLNNKKDTIISDAIDYYFNTYQALHDEYLLKHNNTIVQTIRNMSSYKKLALFTGKGLRGLTISLKKLGYSNLFDYIISDDDVVKSKPSSEGLNEIIEHFSIDRSKCIFIGDSQADIKSGDNAGIETIGVNWFRKNKFVSLHKYISDNITDLKY